MTRAEQYQREWAEARGIEWNESHARLSILDYYREVRDIAAHHGIGESVLDDLWHESATPERTGA